MKISEFNQKNGILICLLLLVVTSPVFSQTQLIAFNTSINYQFTVPIICVIGLTAFLVTAFIKQKK